MAASTRFARTDGGLIKTCLRWSICFILGVSSFTNAETLEIPGSVLELDWQDQFGKREQQRIRDWLTYTAVSASGINGKFPAPRVRIKLHKIRRGKGPVPWAHTVRSGNPDGIVFHVNPSKSLSEFKRDWTATHEFSHLYLPYIGRRDMWLSEGFASYYQHILMMRQGTLSEKEGWQKIKAGFDRGIADPYQTGTLKHASENMRQTRAFKRVYWTGAIYFLTLDIALRKQGSSLDEVVAEFQRCCRHSRNRWDGEILSKQLDKASNSDLFSTTYAEFQQMEGFPEFESLFQELGISVARKKVKLGGNEEQSSLRKAISFGALAD